MLPSALTATRPRLASLLVVATACAVAGVAAAEPEAPVASARLDVDANPSCTTRADLMARVRARSPRVRFVDDGSLAIRAQFSTTSAGEVIGDVTLARAGTKPSARRVLAQSCAEAAEAVALIIAVTLDPSSAVGSTEAASDGTSADPEKPPTAASKPPSSPARPAAESPPAQHADRAARSGNRATFGAELAVQSFFGPAPGVMPGVALYAKASIDGPTLWSPAVLLGVTHAWRTVEEQGGTASFTLDAGSLDACPLRLRLGVLQARPCGSVLVGRLLARATETRNAAGESARPFAVVGGVALVTADLAWLLEVSARLAVGANLVRDSFEFTPVVFHTVPALTVAASVGVGLHWP